MIWIGCNDVIASCCLEDFFVDHVADFSGETKEFERHLEETGAYVFLTLIGCDPAFLA